MARSASAVAPVAEIVETTTPRKIGTSNLARTIRGHRHRYAKVIRPDGKATTTNGDRVATILLAVPLPTLAAFVHGHFGKSYEHLNKGHERMCCGNLVRAAATKDDAKVLAFLEAHAG